MQSLVTTVQSADAMDNMVGLALAYQEILDCRTSPWEMHLWDQVRLVFLTSLEENQMYKLYLIGKY